MKKSWGEWELKSNHQGKWNKSQELIDIIFFLYSFKEQNIN